MYSITNILFFTTPSYQYLHPRVPEEVSILAHRGLLTSPHRYLYPPAAFPAQCGEALPSVYFYLYVQSPL